MITTPAAIFGAGLIILILGGILWAVYRTVRDAEDDYHG